MTLHPLPRSSRRRRRHLPMRVLLLVLLLSPAPLLAQSPARSLKLEANGGLTFGNAQQSTVLTRLSSARSDSTLELRVDAGYTYGETRIDDVASVAKRSWQGAVTADFRPFSRISPFTLASVESSFEKRIHRRYAGGGGAKAVFAKTPALSSDVSVALLAERSILDTADAGRTEQIFARWSARYRLERKLDERVTASLLAFYRPEFADVERFTTTSRASVAYRVAAALALQGSFVDNYDSEARSRGARSNNDGELLFGLVATF